MHVAASNDFETVAVTLDWNSPIHVWAIDLDYAFAKCSFVDGDCSREWCVAWPAWHIDRVAFFALWTDNDDADAADFV